MSPERGVRERGGGAVAENPSFKEYLMMRHDLVIFRSGPKRLGSVPCDERITVVRDDDILLLSRVVVRDDDTLLFSRERQQFDFRPLGFAESSDESSELTTSSTNTHYAIVLFLVASLSAKLFTVLNKR